MVKDSSFSTVRTAVGGLRRKSGSRAGNSIGFALFFINQVTQKKLWHRSVLCFSRPFGDFPNSKMINFGSIWVLVTRLDSPTNYPDTFGIFHNFFWVPDKMFEGAGCSKSRPTISVSFLRPPKFTTAFLLILCKPD